MKIVNIDSNDACFNIDAFRSYRPPYFIRNVNGEDAEEHRLLHDMLDDVLSTFTGRSVTEETIHAIEYHANSRLKGLIDRKDVVFFSEKRPSIVAMRYSRYDEMIVLVMRWT